MGKVLHKQVGHPAAGPEAAVPGTEPDPADAGVQDGPGAHGAGLQGDIELAVLQPPGAQGLVGLSDVIYQHEIALYKVSTPEFQENPMASKVIRRYSARIVEVNPVFSIVEKNGMSEEITALYEELRGLGCVLQFVRSGRVAITTSCFERVNE